MIGILLLLSIILMVYILLLYFDNLDIMKSIILSIISFFSFYIFLSSVYFFINKFSVKNVLLTIIAIEFVIILVLHVKKFKINYTIVFKNYIIPVVIFVALIPFIINKNEYYGMGQDEGVYQTAAINFIYNKTNNNIILEEYNDIYDSNLKNQYYNAIKDKLIGFYDYYRYGDYPTVDNELNPKYGNVPPNIGTLHGIPTFPAMLALWGGIFGISHMADIQTVFFFCTIFILSILLDNLKLAGKVHNRILFLLLFGLSPIIIWVAKSTLTEMFLTLLMCTYFYFLSSNLKNKEYLSTVPIIVFAFFHISIYTLVPLFVFIYFYMYIKNNNKKYLISNILFIIGFNLGLTFMALVQPRYTFFNISRLYSVLPFLNDYNIIPFIYFVSLISLIIFTTFIVVKVENNQFIPKLNINIGKIYIWFIRGCLLIGVGLLCFRVIQYKDRIGEIGTTIQRMSLYSFALFSGFLLFIVLYIMLILKTSIFLKNDIGIIMVFAFLYRIVFFSVLMNPFIEEYYYYARYLSPFIPIILILGMISLKAFLEWKRNLILGISIILILPFSFSLIKNIDDSNIEWNTLKEMEIVLPDDAAIVIDNELIQYLLLPIKSMTKNKVYPVLGNIEEQLESLSINNKRVYYITNSMIYGKHFQVYNKIKNMFSYDNNENAYSYAPLPKKFITGSTDVIVYEYVAEKLVYDFKNNDFETNGFGYLENDFRWITSETSCIKCFLKQEDYVITIQQGPGIPLDKLGIDKLSIEIKVNDQFIGSIVISSSDAYQNFSITIPKEALIDGTNIVQFQTDLWNPKDVGKNDNRKLGLAIQKIEFTNRQIEVGN